jgi:hypothetical protein
VAIERMPLEARLPRHHLYVKGWLTRVPGIEEADVLAAVCRRISTILAIGARYLSGALEFLSNHAPKLIEAQIAITWSSRPCLRAARCKNFR